MSFSDLIIWCCSQRESTLRNKIKQTLKKKSFSVFEDDYKSYRNLKGVSNLLLVRGSPQFCLVAHTDVCRDHSSYEMDVPVRKPKPVIKVLNGRKIIQDKTETVQVGGDDRLGVAIALWCALHTEQDLALLFTTDEEVGLISASYCSFEQLNNYKLLIQIDRGNNSNQVVNQIGGLDLCDSETVSFIQERMDASNIKRNFVVGRGTDVYAIRQTDTCKNAINMTCGYHNSYGDSGEEYIDIEEAEESRDFVLALIK